MPQPIKTSLDSSCPPNSSSCSHFKCILLGILVLVIGLSAGLYIGGQGSSSTSYNPSSSIQPSSQKSEVKKGSYEDGYQSALEFARKKLVEKGMFVSSSKSGRNMLSRVAVKSVSGNSITVEFDASLIDIFSEGTVTKTITVSDTVKIEKRTPKDPEEVQKAFDEFRKQQEELRKSMESGDRPKDLLQPPTTYTSENVNISDLKAGDLLNIFYEADATNPDMLNAISIELVNPDLAIKMRGDAGVTAPSDVAPTTRRSSASDTTVANPSSESVPPVRTRTSEAPAAEVSPPTRTTPSTTEAPDTTRTTPPVTDAPTTTEPTPPVTEAPTTTEPTPVQ